MGATGTCLAEEGINSLCLKPISKAIPKQLRKRMWLTDMCFFPVLVPDSKPVLRAHIDICALNFPRSYLRGVSCVPLSNAIVRPHAQ